MAELTAWQDINPPMASAPRQGLVSTSLEPATSDQFRNELVACLALVAPAGMTEEARRDWLRVAWESLKHLPADMLHRGAEKARATCDHPAKIVPAIIAETRDWYESRKDRASPSPVPMIEGPRPPRSAAALMDARGKAMTDAETDILNAHLDQLGSTARYRPDGSKYHLTKAA